MHVRTHTRRTPPASEHVAETPSCAHDAHVLAAYAIAAEVLFEHDLLLEQHDQFAGFGVFLEELIR